MHVEFPLSTHFLPVRPFGPQAPALSQNIPQQCDPLGHEGSSGPDVNADQQLQSINHWPWLMCSNIEPKCSKNFPIESHSDGSVGAGGGSRRGSVLLVPQLANAWIRSTDRAGTWPPSRCLPNKALIWTHSSSSSHFHYIPFYNISLGLWALLSNVMLWCTDKIWQHVDCRSIQLPPHYVELRWFLMYVFISAYELRVSRWLYPTAVSALARSLSLSSASSQKTLSFQPESPKCWLSYVATDLNCKEGRPINKKWRWHWLEMAWMLKHLDL